MSAAVATEPELSIVVTVLNEEGTVDELYERTVAAVDGRPFELLFVDDGSTDRTFDALKRLHARDPRVHAIRFARNFGQHPAMHAGFTRAQGDILVTMDGDLQNQPEDIPRLVAAVESGAEVASGRRRVRRDSWGRTLPSRLINGMLRRFTGVAISDFGCAFNAYRRCAVVPMLGAIGKQKFTKALVLSGGASVVEVNVAHAPRQGASRYSPLRLTRLALHVLAGFWPQPIQWIGVAIGAVCSVAALGLAIYEIVSLDALTYAGNVENLADVMSHERLSFVEGDIRDEELVRDIVAHVDVIVNAAAESHVEKSIVHGGSQFVKTNVEGTQILLDAIREAPVERFVLISSSEVYGTAERAPMDEEHPLNPRSPYAATKAGADRLAYSYWTTYELPIVIVRPFNNYGPRQHPEKVVPRFITQALDDEPLTVHGDGHASRDWLYVTDDAEAIVAAIRAPIESIAGEVVNVATGVDISIADVAR